MDPDSLFPEAVPLKTVDTETEAAALVTIFSHLKIPEEVHSDQGANFISKLMQALYKLLEIKPIYTTPYHSQTNGQRRDFMAY